MWGYVNELYTYAMEHGCDPRTKEFFLLSSPMPTIIIVIIYLIGVTKVGPSWMENKKPYDLKNVLIVYNAIQVTISCLLFWMNLYPAILGGYSIFRCQDINFSPSEPEGVYALWGAYCYFLMKFVELLDTVFFLLRKKNNQITFLHLFHHAQQPLFMWLVCKFLPGGSVGMGMAENSFIHVIMYTYYFLAGLGPHMQKYLWWKKYLTSLQLTQFALALIHIVLMLIHPNECKTMYRPFIYAGGLYILSLYILFKNFYNQSYTNDNESINNTAEKID